LGGPITKRTNQTRLVIWFRSKKNDYQNLQKPNTGLEARLISVERMSPKTLWRAPLQRRGPSFTICTDTVLKAAFRFQISQ
jgi:hypothetical protein